MESPDAPHIELDATLDVFPEIDDEQWQPPSILDVPPSLPTPTPILDDVDTAGGPSDPTLRAVLAVIAEKRRVHTAGKRPRHVADYNGLVSGTAGQRMMLDVDAEEPSLDFPEDTPTKRARTSVVSTGSDDSSLEALLDEDDISRTLDEVLGQLTAQELERKLRLTRDSDASLERDTVMDVDSQVLRFPHPPHPENDPPTAGLRLRLEFEGPWVPDDSVPESQPKPPRRRPSPPPRLAPTPSPPPPPPPPFDDSAARLSRCPCSRCSPNEEWNARARYHDAGPPDSGFDDDNELSAHAHAEQQDEIHRLFALSPFAVA
uniref:Uncharacterized protein n=1 Tax=Mycena chlorophos TaxID=658473 RepID=A0ABQ0KZ08_MYCCL|nr:predicted protein [Mycena chlorophos]